ncbi:MAG: hypothetical protein OEU09_15875 [Rhodospirillales bacterium]|nr:hypothetical protein [Rhodospirillales bacterium]MDH3912764.1 hypothetical protein [Rhodospirillales bacterium]MDH3916846.1 hypothetical protein [Rhodospirillales bacterium]MDH3967875.1 hypothetical protein [Rhodospirillales bacterium]
MTGAEVRKLLSLGEWTAASQVHGPRTYPAAYREVKEWYDKAGHAGLMDFINRLRQGTSFADAMASVVEGSQKPNEDRGA